MTQKLPQINTAYHATFPIHIRKMKVEICGNYWVTHYIIKRQHSCLHNSLCPSVSPSVQLFVIETATCTTQPQLLYNLLVCQDVGLSIFPESKDHSPYFNWIQIQIRPSGKTASISEYWLIPKPDLDPWSVGRKVHVRLLIELNIKSTVTLWKTFIMDWLYRI